MSFKKGEPIPQTLRDALNKVLGKRDYQIISLKEGMASESTIRDLLVGAKVTGYSHDTVCEMVRHAVAKCDDFVNLYARLKSTIGVYNTKIEPIHG